ncbi:MAG: DUF3833 family protein [Hyphomicrobiales bacterium]
MNCYLKAVMVLGFMGFPIFALANVPHPKANPLTKAPVQQQASLDSKETINLQKRFTLEGFFVGETIGRGSIFSKIAGVGRSFRTSSSGVWDGKVLTLVETYQYAATSPETRVWRFTKTGKGTYTAESDEILEKATIKIEGRVAKLKYKKNIPRPDKKKPAKVTFNEKWTLRKNGVLESRSELKKIVRVGREAINFVRVGNESALKSP